MTLYHFLVVSAILFSIGLYGVLTRRNILGIFMSIELMFNAANLNLIAFNHYLYPGNVWGQGFVLFIITLAAAEAVVGLSLVLAIYRNIKSVYTENMTILHG
ncbi:MAG: NADH-quinone oxidoreductase subunit NuoK [Elusimicrobiota bacterium]|jgi:NADH:ubiquinone oxidoreductase subunit K